jgi:hypothetical protein
MKAKAFVSAMAGVLCSGLVIASVAWAAGATTKVTIALPNSKTSTLHGKVFSAKLSCVKRTVDVLRQQGSSQDPSTDPVVATTKSMRADSTNHGVWKLSAAMEPHAGFYYAEATKKTGCKVGFSPTVHLVPSH